METIALAIAAIVVVVAVCGVVYRIAMKYLAQAQAPVQEEADPATGVAQATNSVHDLAGSLEWRIKQIKKQGDAATGAIADLTTFARTLASVCVGIGQKRDYYIEQAGLLDSLEQALLDVENNKRYIYYLAGKLDSEQFGTLATGDVQNKEYWDAVMLNTAKLRGEHDKFANAYAALARETMKRIEQLEVGLNQLEAVKQISKVNVPLARATAALEERQPKLRLNVQGPTLLIDNPIDLLE